MSINDNKDLKFIKKHYGEEFAKCCREWFPTLLEQPGLLSTLISEHIEPTKNLLQDIEEENPFIDAEEFFKNFVYSAVDVEKEKPQVMANKTAEQLFDEAGYVLYPECRTEAEIQKFKKLYAHGEKLCTFNGGRLNYCRVWFAVKKNVKDIKRENFTEPKRQDEYGTSVISIQYTKKEPSTLSIKNRYNHTVNNPDATFSNNLDNIAPGLTDVFEKQFCILSEKAEFKLDINPYVFVDGKLFRYNFEYENIYYCGNNVIIDNFEVKRYDKARYIVFDNYIIDKKDKTIVKYNNTDNPKNSEDGFTKSFGEIKEVIENTTQKGREVVVIPKNGEGIKLVLDDNNALLEYHSNNLTTAGDGFLMDAHNLTSFDAPNLETVGHDCLTYAYDLKSFDAPKLKTVGDCFLMDADNLTSFDAPNLKTVGGHFLMRARADNLTSFDAPNLKTAGDGFFCYAYNLRSFNAPKLETVGMNFLFDAWNLASFNAPKLKTVGGGFLMNAENLTSFDCPIVPEHLQKRLKH